MNLLIFKNLYFRNTIRVPYRLDPKPFLGVQRVCTGFIFGTFSAILSAAKSQGYSFGVVRPSVPYPNTQSFKICQYRLIDT